MKGKDKKAIQSKTAAELGILLKEKQQELGRVRMELAMNKIKNVHAASLLRHEIARIETARKISEAKEEKNG